MRAVEAVLDEEIVRIEKIVLRGRRPRSIGFNARIAAHGALVRDPLVRLYTRGGGRGIGWSGVSAAEAQQLLGRRLGELFQLPEGCLAAGRALDLVLWDLVARLLDLPLYRLLGARGARQVELYDGSIYIDDLEADDDEAEGLFAEEVESGRKHGYRNFKIKVGRGARWMPTEAGLARDGLVVHAVRRAAGPEAKILIDANMGNTLNTARDLLEGCAGAEIYWFEEPFAEDRALNQALKEFIEEKGWDTLVADGEFAPPPYFFELVEEGLIDVVQHDFRGRGLTWWRATAARLEACGALCAPHCWGSYLERYAHAHFAASIPNYALLEAAPASMPGLIEEGWEMQAGKLLVPDTPGAGFEIEAAVWERALEDVEAFSLSL